MTTASEKKLIAAQSNEVPSPTIPWINERDNHDPDSFDIDFLTLLLENEFK